MERIASNNAKLVESGVSEGLSAKVIEEIVLAQADRIEITREQCREAERQLINEQLKLIEIRDSLNDTPVWSKLSSEVLGAVMRSMPSSVSSRDY